MSAPPKDIDARELFKKLLETPRPSDVVDFPRKIEGKAIGQVRIFVLTGAEMDGARERVENYFTRTKKKTADEMQSPMMRALISDRTAYEILVMACHTVEPQLEDASTGEPIYGKIFHNPDEIREQLTAEEVEVLFNLYQLVQDKFGPREHTVNVDQWVNRLVEGGQHYPLLSLALPELVSLTSSLAERIYSISSALGSQWSELPATCQSSLETSVSGISSFTSPLYESESETTENFDLSVDDALALGDKRRKLVSAIEPEE